MEPEGLRKLVYEQRFSARWAIRSSYLVVPMHPTIKRADIFKEVPQRVSAFTLW